MPRLRGQIPGFIGDSVAIDRNDWGHLAHRVDLVSSHAVAGAGDALEHPMQSMPRTTLLCCSTDVIGSCRPSRKSWLSDSGANLVSLQNSIRIHDANPLLKGTLLSDLKGQPHSSERIVALRNTTFSQLR